MTTGIMDFSDGGRITGEALPREEVFWMVAMAHDAGYSVMAHTNGARAVINAVEAVLTRSSMGTVRTRKAFSVWRSTVPYGCRPR